MNAQVNGTETPNPAIVTKVEIAWMAAGDASEAAAVAAGRGVTLTALQDMANFMQATCQGVAPNAAGYALSSSYLVSGVTYTPSVRITDSAYGQGSWTRGTAFNGTATTTTTTSTTTTSTTTTATTTSTTTTSAPVGGTTVYTDNFNRTNGALTTPWTQSSSAGGTVVPTITSNQVGNSGGNTARALYNSALSADQFCQFTIASYDAANTRSILASVRSSLTANTSYSAEVYDNNGAGQYQIRILKLVAGTGTVIGAAVTLGSSFAGKVLRCEVQGTTIRALLDGVVQVTATDSAITSGLPAFDAPTGAKLDDWSAGTIP